MEPTFTTRWFFHNATKETVLFGRHTCAICGLPTREAAPRHKVLRSTFSDYDVLRVRNGDDVCPACEWYMSNQDLRRSGWWLTQNEARQMKKQDWLALLREHIEQPPDEDGYYLIKPSGFIGIRRVSSLTGKHLALLAPLNLAHNPVRRVQFDTVALDLTAQWLELVEASHRLREHHSWREIVTDDYIATFVTERWDDLSEFVRLREVVKPWLRTPQLNLAQFVWFRSKKGEDDNDETDK